MQRHFAWALFLAAGLLQLPASGAAEPPNILVVVADDVGVDLVGSYGEIWPGAPTPPEHLATPNIDALAASGVLFRNAWSTPYCSATRAALLTGRYGFRTGVGSAVGLLPRSQVILPSLLDERAGYVSAALGKWHVTSYFPDRPNRGYTPVEAGFDLFRGSAGNLEDLYFSWNKATEEARGAASYLPEHDRYATTDTVDDALAWLAGQEEPWFLYVAFHAIHAPLEVPPDELHTQQGVKDRYEPGDVVVERAVNVAMLEAMDTELGRLLDAIDLATTTVFFVGDNGTVESLAVPERINRAGKGSVFEGGINVPLIIAGAGVSAPPGSEASALTHVVDLFATVLDLADVPVGAPPLPIDGVSLRPVLADPTASVRTTVYTDGNFLQTVAPGTNCPTRHDVAIRNDRFKLIRREKGTLQLYDLVADPGERQDLMPRPLTPEATAALAELKEALHDVTAASLPCKPASCGIGAELVFLLPLLTRLRRRSSGGSRARRETGSGTRTDPHPGRRARAGRLPASLRAPGR